MEPAWQLCPSIEYHFTVNIAPGNVYQVCTRFLSYHLFNSLFIHVLY